MSIFQSKECKSDFWICSAMFDVEYSGGILGDHPNRHYGAGSCEKVSISEEATLHGPRSVGKIVIEATSNGNETKLATDEFLAD